MVLADLRVHRAGPHRSRRDLRRGSGRLVQITLGIGNELRPAAGTAEVMVMAGMGRVMRRPVRIDGHAADRIQDRTGGRPPACLRMPATAAMTPGMRFVLRRGPRDRKSTRLN